MESNKYMLRAARNTLMDQLLLSKTVPIADLPAKVEQLIVPYNNYDYIAIDYSQPDVHYEVYDNEDKKAGEADGNSSTLRIKTGNLVNEDYTFSIKASKINYSTQLIHKNATYAIVEHSFPGTRYELYNKDGKMLGVADGNGGPITIPTGAPVNEDSFFSVKSTYGIYNQLLQTVRVKVGIDTSLPVSLKNPLIDFNTTATVIVGRAQSNTRYELLDPKDVSLGRAVASGPGGDIQLETNPLKEDTVIKIKATNIKTGLTDLLTTQPEIKVNPDISLTAALKSPSAYNGQAIIRLDNTQKSVDYQLRLDDIDDDAVDKLQLKNMFTGAAVTGTGGTIELPTGLLQEDVTVNILATKKISGSSKPLSTKVPVPVRPNPAKVLSIVKDTTSSGRTTPVSSVTPGAGTVIKVAGTQRGILYQLRSGNINIGLPGYHHKNYGIGKARVGIELAVGQFTDDSVYLPTGSLGQTTTFSIQAIKATTRQETPLANTITIPVK